MPEERDRAARAADGRELLSLVTAGGELALRIAPLGPPPALAPDEVRVAIRAAPVNPSDLALLLADADPAALRADPAGAGGPACRGAVPRDALPAMALRLDRPLPVGNEGAGMVVATGESEAARALLGRAVGMVGGGTYATHRRYRARDLLVLPDGMEPASGASWFVNPMTALAMVEAMRAEGHRALVHTAAASNLGRMLVGICREDGVGLVNVVRSPEQERALRALGAAHVCDTGREDFDRCLLDALEATGATLCFDALGGGALAGRILGAMEVVAARAADRYDRYGSRVRKQVHLYGLLDRSPLVLGGGYGMRWGVGGWLVSDFLAGAAAGTVERMRDRVRDGLGSLFRSAYARTVPLDALLDPAVLAEASRRGTGGKLLVNPEL